MHLISLKAGHRDVNDKGGVVRMKIIDVFVFVIWYFSISLSKDKYKTVSPNKPSGHWNVNNESEDDKDGKGVREDGVHVK